jgi:hypothetical protein
MRGTMREPLPRVKMSAPGRNQAEFAAIGRETLPPRHGLWRK